MRKPTDAERLAVVETKLDIVLEQLKTTNEKLDILLPTFATHDDLHKQVKHLHQQLERIEKKRWVQNTLSAILGSVLTGLIGYVLMNIFK